MNSNSDNPKVGKRFQEIAKNSLESLFEKSFEIEKAIPIGNPPKNHRFDLVSSDEMVVVECKCYTWTDAGNVPSAKLMGLNEAALYLHNLPDNVEKILCLMKATHSKKTETLAEYYCRIDGHLLGNIKVVEIDEGGVVRIIRE